MDKVDTAANVADIGTKQVTPVKQFEKLRDIVQGVTPSLYLSEKVKDILKGVYDKVVHVLIADDCSGSLEDVD